MCYYLIKPLFQSIQSKEKHKKQMKGKENGIYPPDMHISLFGPLLAPFP
jgi:hypothetical protein